MRSLQPSHCAEFITLRQAQERYGVSPKTLTDWVNHSDMPLIYQLCSGQTGWRFSELANWEQQHCLWQKIGKTRKKKFKSTRGCVS